MLVGAVGEVVAIYLGCFAQEASLGSAGKSGTAEIWDQGVYACVRPASGCVCAWRESTLDEEG